MIVLDGSDKQICINQKPTDVFSWFFLDVTSHPSNYCIDVDILEIFLKLFRQFFDVYFFDYQEIVFHVSY